MANLRQLKTPTNERITVLLEELLADAKAGKLTGVFVFSESINGKVTHSRDGMPDATVVFWLELIKRRLLGAYE